MSIVAARWTYHGIAGLLALILLLAGTGASAEAQAVEEGGAKNENGEAAAQGAPGFYIPIERAKDCAYDHVRHRLYVTTLTQLVVVDIKQRKVLESIDLLGNVQGLDISPGAKFLVVAPVAAQYLYKFKLDWETLEDLDIHRIKFRADSTETGVFSVGIGADGSALFSTTFAGSGWVKLRRLNPNDSIVELEKVRMDSLIAVSGDRTKAYIGEGNISSGPIWMYDFKRKSMVKGANLNDILYELAASGDGSRFARPCREGCDLYDVVGGKIGSLAGAPVIGAAFNPKGDSLYVLRHGEVDIQEYDINGKLLARAYPLDKPLVIRGDVHERLIANLHPVGRDRVLANFRLVTNLNFKTYQSGRMRVSEDGKVLCAVVPGGVYVFPVKPPEKSATTKPKVKITDK